jgi:hypothetical protein
MRGEDQMRKMIIGATVLLIVQLGLTVALFLGNKDVDAAPPDTVFLGFAPEAVRSLTITDEKGETLELVKNSDGWVIPKHFSAPVDKIKMDTLLGKLAALKQGFVVATSDDAASRFKVGDGAFNDHVTVKGEEKTLADFYVGTSPAFRQVHARRSDSKDIVIVDLDAYEFATSPDQWLDRSLMKVHEDDLSALEFDGVTLRKERDGWRLDGLGEDESPNKTGIDALIVKVSGLLIEDVLDPHTVSGLFAKPAYHFVAVSKDGKKVQYEFAKIDENSYALKTSDTEVYGKVTAASVASLQQQSNRDKLVEVKASGENSGLGQAEQEDQHKAAAPPPQPQ